ncbi:hypothetical protein Anapl_11707 [Anas platyrhynchos]|uniref:Uncharacterized protein n=1 Tax=Anas platyrhynchos TaxID=8839 RepID=R0JTP1_ANAPL|nr:hypothetical protein Anapl_11707 [Anas platyrhynchos]
MHLKPGDEIVHPGAAPLLEEPNKRQNMNIPQLLCGDEKFQKNLNPNLPKKRT